MKQQRRLKQKVFATGDSRRPVQFIQKLISSAKVLADDVEEWTRFSTIVPHSSPSTTAQSISMVVLPKNHQKKH